MLSMLTEAIGRTRSALSTLTMRMMRPVDQFMHVGIILRAQAHDGQAHPTWRGQGLRAPELLEQSGFNEGEHHLRSWLRL
jgi:hypothetical protein